MGIAENCIRWRFNSKTRPGGVCDLISIQVGMRKMRCYLDSGKGFALFHPKQKSEEGFLELILKGEYE